MEVRVVVPEADVDHQGVFGRERAHQVPDQLHGVATERVERTRVDELTDELHLGLKQQLGAGDVQLAGHAAPTLGVVAGPLEDALGTDRDPLGETQLRVCHHAAAVVDGIDQRIAQERRQVSLVPRLDQRDVRSIGVGVQRRGSEPPRVGRMLGEPQAVDRQEPTEPHVDAAALAGRLLPHHIVLARPQAGGRPVAELRRAITDVGVQRELAERGVGVCLDLHREVRQHVGRRVHVAGRAAQVAAERQPVGRRDLSIEELGRAGQHRHRLRDIEPVLVEDPASRGRDVAARTGLFPVHLELRVRVRLAGGGPGRDRQRGQQGAAHHRQSPFTQRMPWATQSFLGVSCSSLYAPGWPLTMTQSTA